MTDALAPADVLTNIPPGWAIRSASAIFDRPYTDITVFGDVERTYVVGPTFITLDVEFVHPKTGTKLEARMTHPQQWPEVRDLLIFLAEHCGCGRSDHSVWFD